MIISYEITANLTLFKANNDVNFKKGNNLAYANR